MSFAIVARAEVLKTKRTASVWLSVLGAGFVPAMLLTFYLMEPQKAVSELKQIPWEEHFEMGWNIMSAFLCPMYIILICTLIPQIEYRNNSWKQVFAAPQSIGTIFFSKFLTIHLLIVFFFLLFNFFMIGTAIVANSAHADFKFFDKALPVSHLLLLNFKTYISILGISAIQYVLSLRIKNFIAPIGTGLVLLVGGVILQEVGWKHIFKLPYAYPMLTLQFSDMKNRPLLENHEWNSIAWCVAVLAIGFLELKLRKEKG